MTSQRQFNGYANGIYGFCHGSRVRYASYINSFTCSRIRVRVLALCSNIINEKELVMIEITIGVTDTPLQNTPTNYHPMTSAIIVKKKY